MSGVSLDLAVRVRADGSGLVGQLGADEAAIERVGAAAIRASAGTRQLAAGSADLAQQANRAASALDQEGQAAGAYEQILSRLENRYDQAGVAQRRFFQDQSDLSTLRRAGVIDAEHEAILLTGMERSYQRSDAAARRHGQTMRDNHAISRQAQAGYQQLSYQIGDVTQGLALGVSPAVIFAQQIGQITQAIQLTMGTATGFARFMTGPWGAAIIGLTTVVAMMTASLFANEEATRVAETGANALGAAQSVLGQIFDLTSGRIERQNALLIANARLTAINLRAEAMGARTSANQTFQSGLAPRNGMLGSFFSGLRGRRNTAGADILRPHIDRIRNARTPEERALAIDRALRETEGVLTPGADPNTDVLGNLSNISTQQWRQALIDLARAEQNDNVAGAIDRSLDGGVLDPSLRRGGSNRSRRGRSNSAASRLNEFGSDARDRIAELGAQFDDTPSQVARVNRALHDLDDLMEDIGERHPPDFQRLLAQGREARTVIEDGINRPFRDFIDGQAESLRILELQSLGRDDEAEAMRAVLQLQDQMGPLTRQQKDDVLATVQAIRAQQRELEVLRERQQAYLDAIGQTRDLIRGTIEGVLNGDLGALRDLPGQIRKSFNTLLSRYLEQNLFGGIFRQLEDQVTGANTARDASDRMAQAVDRASRSIARLGDAAEGAASGVASSAQQEQAETDITVTGTRARFPTDPAEFFGFMFENLSRGILGDRAARVIGRVVGQALEGAAYGSIGGSIVGMLGGRQSQTGSAIGGAIGNVAGEALKGGITKLFGSTIGGAAGPIGAVLGGILGSLAGGLLTSSKRGSATITSVDGAASTRGNSSDFRSASSGLAGNVQDALKQIADTLGGELGSFAVSIGLRDGKLRVDPTGKGVTKTKKGAVDFGDDEAGAVAFAILDAIKDGAVTGLSAAVQQALRSSSDIDEALREALKVDEIEKLLAGVGGELDRTFRDFEKQAAERLRIGSRYGFDLVKLEELNAKERADIFEQIMADRVGRLRDLLDDLNFGDLFEGTIVDQRDRLLLEVAKAEAEAKDGVEGAADRVADLRRQLLDLTRGGFGTAGPEFAEDLASTRSAAEEIIRLENERVKAAQDAQIAANQKLDTGNQLANEANNLLSSIDTTIRGIAERGGADASSAYLVPISTINFSTNREVDL